MRNQILMAGLLAFLAACSTTKPAPKPARPAPAPVPVELSPIHRNLDPLDAVWHVRAGLNVAALSCAQQKGVAVVSDYNQFLKAKEAVLAEAYAALSAKYRARGGNWQRMLDTDMTKLYNHFASPTAQTGFCDVAAEEVKRAIAARPDARQEWAMAALERLDRPFVVPASGVSRQAGAAKVMAPMPVARDSVSRTGEMAANQGALPVGWRVQLGAFGSKNAAENAWSALKSRSSELGGMTPHFEQVPGKSLTRLQVKGVDSKEEAIRLCALAAAAGSDCFPVRPV